MLCTEFDVQRSKTFKRNINGMCTRQIKIWNFYNFYNLDCVCRIMVANIYTYIREAVLRYKILRCVIPVVC